MEQYSLRSPGVRRLLREAAELSESNSEYSAVPLDDNLFEWHFTIRGPPASEFENGIYHGRIIMPSDYPMQPPTFIMLTPSGRFQTETKICLSISSYHPENWLPSWSIRTALVALRSFMCVPSPGTIGSIESSASIRRALARRSNNWECGICGLCRNLIKPTSVAPSATVSESGIQETSDQESDGIRITNDPPGIENKTSISMPQVLNPESAFTVQRPIETNKNGEVEEPPLVENAELVIHNNYANRRQYFYDFCIASLVVGIFAITLLPFVSRDF